MREGAQVQLALDLWEAYTYDEPADQYIHKSLKENRFMGSKDRRKVRDLFFHLVRRETFLRDKLESLSQINPIPGGHNPGRLMYLIDLKERGFEGMVNRIFTGEGYDPKPLTDFELSLFDLENIPSLTPYGALSLSPFWYEKLREEFGEYIEIEAEAFAKEAPLDLRVNTLKMSRGDALLMLRRHGYELSQTAFSPHGMRMRSEGRVDLNEFILKGDMEPQDEGSQIIAMMVNACPGMRVLDYCAGAGGKTLSLAMHMENKGTLIASDISKVRLERSAERLKRLGIHNCTTVMADGKWRKKHPLQFDRVLVDAPCSGSGTWRRNPDLMLRTDATDIQELVEKQRAILSEVAPLVKQGGRLIYATCSLIHDENDDQINWFLEQHPDFRLIPLARIWELSTPAPSEEDMWHLTTSQHHTDGFFMACLEKMHLN